MKKIIMGVVILAVLLGGGGAAYFVFLKKPAEAALPEEAAADAHKKDEKKADKKGGGGHGAESEEGKVFYVKMDPLVVPMVDDQGASQIISMVVTFQAESAEASLEIENQKPRVKDAFITSLYGLLNEQDTLQNGVLKISYVKERLNAAAQKVLGPDVVKDVLLQMVQQNPT